MVDASLLFSGGCLHGQFIHPSARISLLSQDDNEGIHFVDRRRTNGIIQLAEAPWEEH